MTIDKNKYEKIHHLRFNSFDCPNEIGKDYRCYVAVKKKIDKQICLYDLAAVKPKEQEDKTKGNKK